MLFCHRQCGQGVAGGGPAAGPVPVKGSAGALPAAPGACTAAPGSPRWLVPQNRQLAPGSPGAFLVTFQRGSFPWGCSRGRSWGSRSRTLADGSHAAPRLAGAQARGFRSEPGLAPDSVRAPIKHCAGAPSRPPHPASASRAPGAPCQSLLQAARRPPRPAPSPVLVQASPQSLWDPAPPAGCVTANASGHVLLPSSQMPRGPQSSPSPQAGPEGLA